MSFKKKLRKLLITTGIILSIGLTVAGCGAKDATPASTPAVTTETTADPYALGDVDITLPSTPETLADNILSSKDGAYTAITPEEETQHAYDKYGPLGKEVFDNIAQMWVDRTLEAEPDLRELMTLTYGDLSTLETLTQDILALPRNPIEQPTQQPAQETQPAETQLQTPAPTKSHSQTPAPQETQPTPQETQQQTPAPQKTQPAPQETQQQTPAPPADTTPTPGNLIPGTNIPSTGNPQLDAALRDSENNSQSGVGAVGNEHGIGYTDQGADLNWN